MLHQKRIEMNVVIFSSRTGSDAQHIADRQWELGISAVVFVTNNAKSPLLKGGWNSNLIYVLPKNPTLEDYKEVLVRIEEFMPIDYIFLMGYMRVIPEEICAEYKIYNLHPGDIVKFPELKGKDPQEKAYRLELPSTGVVIHKATKDVDCGEIMYRRECKINYQKGVSQLYHTLGQLAKRSWYEFILGLTR